MNTTLNEILEKSFKLKDWFMRIPTGAEKQNKNTLPMKYSSILFLIIISNLSVFAQAKQHVVLTNGSKIFGKEVKLRSPLFGKAQFEVDGQKFEFDDVEEYQDKNRFYKKFSLNEFDSKIPALVRVRTKQGMN